MVLSKLYCQVIREERRKKERKEGSEGRGRAEGGIEEEMKRRGKTFM